MLLDRPILAAATAVTLPMLLIGDGDAAARRLVDAAVATQAGHAFDAALAPGVRAILAAPSGPAGPSPARTPDGFAFLDRWVPGLGAEARAITFHHARRSDEAVRWPAF